MKNNIEVLDKGFVQLVDHMGTDLDVSNAARVSFSKESEWEPDPDEDCWRCKGTGEYLYEHHHSVKLESCRCECWFPGIFKPMHTGRVKLSDKDTKLIRYLAKHNHWTPFGQVNVKFRIKMPIFVARQAMRSNIGIVWNEESRRYIDSEPDIYSPTMWRSRPDGSIKQGSGLETVEVDHTDLEAMKKMVGYYKTMLDDGIAPEMARMVLPQSTYTTVIANFTLAAAARFCGLRSDSHAQWEIQQYSNAMGEIIKTLFPVSWAALMGSE